MSSTTQYGLIILGNSGVGKSFLANILTGGDTFLHQFKPTSVTHTTTSVDVILGSYTFTIFDIPGLIEAEQERIDLNKQEIDKAFVQRPNSIILFVFGQINGRLRGQDIVAFNDINAAYPFKSTSLVLVVNGVTKNRPSDYAGETLVQLQRLLQGVNVNNGNLCFTDQINVNDANKKQALKIVLLPVITKFAPQIHQKKQDIQTVISQLKESERTIQEQQVKLEAERENHRKQLEKQQRIAQQQIIEQQGRQTELQAKLRQQEQRAAAERVAQEAEARRLRDQIAAAGFKVPAGQTHHNNVVLNGNTFYVYGAMNGQISGHGTVRMYNGSKLNGGVTGGAIDIMASGSVTIGGSIHCRNLTFC